MEVLLLYIVLGGCVGAAIGGAQRNRAAAGAILGGIFGPLGWLLVAFGPDRRTVCRFCRRPANAKAVRCPHCQSDLSRGQGPLPPGEVDKILLAEKMARARALAAKSAGNRVDPPMD